MGCGMGVEIPILGQDGHVLTNKAKQHKLSSHAKGSENEVEKGL